MKGKGETKNLTHYHQPLIGILSASRNKPSITHNFLRSHRKTNRNKTPRSIITKASPCKPQKGKTKHAN